MSQVLLAYKWNVFFTENPILDTFIALAFYNKKNYIYIIGDCSSQKEIEEKYGWCRFSHSWHSDSEDLVDIEKLDLVHGVEEGFKEVKQYYGYRLLFIILTIVSLLTVIKIFKNPSKTTKTKLKKK